MGNIFMKGTEASASAEEDDKNEKTCRQLHKNKVKFFQLAHNLIKGETSAGTASCNLVTADVSYRLGLAEQLLRRRKHGGRRVSVAIDEHYHLDNDDDDMSCTVLVLGKTGVGKSATINSILGYNEEQESNSCTTVRTDAFEVATKKIQEVVGAVLEDINIRFIDTPGLSPCSFPSDKVQNEKILRSVKSFVKNKPPDVVLYIDRLDDFTNAGTLADKLMLRTITKVLGPSIWTNAIVVLTHAGASSPPVVLPHDDESNSDRDIFVAQRYQGVQQAIYQACDGWELRSTNMNLPIVLAENNPHHHHHSTTAWKPHLLLLCFALKVLAQANTYLKLQHQATITPRPPFHGHGVVLPPLEAPIPHEEMPFFINHGEDRAVDDEADFKFECEDADLDKDKCNLKMELSCDMKQTTSSLLFDMTARQGFSSYKYRLCGSTSFLNCFKHEGDAGFYVSRDVDSREKLLIVGLKLQNELIVNKWLRLILGGSFLISRRSRNARGDRGNAVAAVREFDLAVLQATLIPLLWQVGLCISNDNRDGVFRPWCYVTNRIDSSSRNLIVTAQLGVLRRHLLLPFSIRFSSLLRNNGEFNS